MNLDLNIIITLVYCFYRERTLIPLYFPCTRHNNLRSISSLKGVFAKNENYLIKYNNI